MCTMFIPPGGVVDLVPIKMTDRWFLILREGTIIDHERSF